MLRFLVRRSLGAMVILLIISAVTFFLFYAVPRDPAMLACGKNCTPDALEVIRKNMGIDEPIPMQYWHFMVGIFAGRTFAQGACPAPCFGYSFANQEPVWKKPARPAKKSATAAGKSSLAFPAEKKSLSLRST